MLELDRLTRRFGDVVALDELTFSVPAGQVFGFVGRNGAGKTTAMRIVKDELSDDLGVRLQVASAAVRATAALARAGVEGGNVLGFFVLGYAFYACVFAAAASAVSRQEELQNATTPLTIVIVASLILSIVAVNNPDGTLAYVFSLVPPFSAIVMPPRLAAGDAAGWQIAVAVVLLLAAIALLVPVAGRIYSNAVLRTRGRVSLRDAYRAGDA